MPKHDRMCTTRHVIAVLWGAIFVLGVMAVERKTSELAGLALYGGLFVAFLTHSRGELEAEESLAQPLAYRVIVGTWFGFALCGAVLALVPGSSETSQFFGVYFGVVAVFAYRAILARGPGRAVDAAVISVLLWFPIMILLVGGPRGEPPSHWTEVTTFVMLEILMLSLPIIFATALVAFRPRQVTVPVARVVRDNR